MTTPHNFSNTASAATLAGSLSSSATTAALDSFVNFPAPPFTATIARNQPTEEIVLVTAVVGSTVTLTRGFDGTAAQAQSPGATFEHTAVAKHFRDAAAHAAATASAHGTTSAVVGVDDVQTLRNKTVVALLAQATAGGPALTADAPTGVTSKLLSLRQAGVEKAFVDYLGNLTAAGVTGTAATFSGALSAAASTLASLAVTGATTLGTTGTGALTATTVRATGAADFDSTLNVDGNVTVGGAATVTGILGAPVVEFTGATTPALPAAGKYRQWTDTDGRLQLRTPTANHRFPVYTIVNDWTVLSTHKDGDFAANVNTGERRIYDSSVLPSGAWVQVRVREVANAAARSAIPSTDRYKGYRVKESDTGSTFEWNGSAWQLAAASFAYRNGATVVSGPAAVPPRFYLGQYTAAFSAVSFNTTAIDYSAAGFTEAPVLVAMSQSGVTQDTRTAVDNVTATGASVVVRTAGSNITASIPVTWIAVGR